MSTEQSNAPSWRDVRTETPGVYRRGDYFRVLTRPDGKRKVMRRFETYEEAVAFKESQPRKTRNYSEATRHSRALRYLLADPCPYCGRPSEAIDHVHARAKGGSDHWSNLVGICAKCNGAKKDKPLLLFLLEHIPYRGPWLPEGRDLFAYISS